MNDFVTEFYGREERSARLVRKLRFLIGVNLVLTGINCALIVFLLTR